MGFATKKVKRRRHSRNLKLHAEISLAGAHIQAVLDFQLPPSRYLQMGLRLHRKFPRTIGLWYHYVLPNGSMGWFVANPIRAMEMARERLAA